MARVSNRPLVLRLAAINNVWLPCMNLPRHVELLIATVVASLLSAETTVSAADGSSLVAFAPVSCTFTEAQEVSLSTSAGDAVIRYTTDGSLPGKGKGKIYESPLSLKDTTLVRAIAVHPDGRASPSASATYLKIAPALAEHRSRLPIMVIDTLGSGPIPGKGWSQLGSGIEQVPRKPAAWLIFDRDPQAGNLANLIGPPQLSARIGIRERGSFSSTWRQKPYSLEAWGAEDEEEMKVSPLGMPKHADWVLYYPDPGRSRDDTLIYNAFMWELSARAGRYAPRFRWVEAFANEDGGRLEPADRRGLYALVEKVTRGRKRLNFKKLSRDGKEGGWLLSINRMDPAYPGGWPAPNGVHAPQFFHTAGSDRILETPPNQLGRGDDFPQLNRAQFNFENPNGYKINLQQRAAIEGWFKQFEDVLYDDQRWLHPTDGYGKYIDPADFVDFFIFNNLAQNFDGLLLSIYPWRSSEDDLLRLGPTWDFNYSCYDRSRAPTGNPMNQRDRLWFGRLFSDPAFLHLYQERWQALRRAALSNASMSEVIAGLVEEIGQANAIAQGFSSAEQWNRRLSSMETWLHQRADWLDDQFPAPPIFSLKDGTVVLVGTLLSISTKQGIIYFTADGSDPKTGFKPSPAAKAIWPPIQRTIVRFGAPARAHVPTDDEAGSAWIDLDFDDSGWLEGKTGVGYDNQQTYRELLGLDVREQMVGKYTGVYVRIPFDVREDPASFVSLSLRMAYDDGFVAYLNGKRIASERAPETLTWNAAATSKNSDQVAINPPEFSLDAHLDLLRKGGNLLATHGLNDGLGSSDMIVSPALIAGIPRADQPDGVRIGKNTEIVARTLLNGLWSAPARMKVSVTKK